MDNETVKFQIFPGDCWNWYLIRCRELFVGQALESSFGKKMIQMQFRDDSIIDVDYFGKIFMGDSLMICPFKWELGKVMTLVTPEG